MLAQLHSHATGKFSIYLTVVICRSRRENLSRAMEHESNGNLTAAYECYQKAVDISPSVAYDLIQVE